MKKPRAFKRDDYLGIRMPNTEKRRLEELARRKFRDTSNLGLEYLIEGINRDERAQKQEANS